MVATMPAFFGQPSFPMPFTPQQPAMSFSQGSGSQPAASGASVLTINLPNATANNYAGGAASASVGQNTPASTFNPANPQQGLYEAYNQAQAAIGNYMNLGRALQAQAFAMQHLPLLPVPGMVPPPMAPVGAMPPMNLPMLMGPPVPQFQSAPPMPGFQFQPGMPPGAPMMGMPPGAPPMGPIMPPGGPMMGMPPGAFPPPPPPPPFAPNMMGPQAGGQFIFPQPPGMM